LIWGSHHLQSAAAADSLFLPFVSQDCLLLDSEIKSTQQYIALAMEMTGAPYSVGDAKGEGVRLVLGGDATVSESRRTDINLRWDA